MASEIRANKQTNRVGLGTVTYTDTGIIVSGIVTANSFKGDGSSLTGIDATALKDGAGNVKVQVMLIILVLISLVSQQPLVLLNQLVRLVVVLNLERISVGYDTLYATVQMVQAHLNYNAGIK